MSDALDTLRVLLEEQHTAIEELDHARLTALEPALREAVAGLPSAAETASERIRVADVEALRARNERRLGERLAEVGSRISRIGYGRSALRAYSPGGGSTQALRVVDHGA
jgi:hypothetical protein